MKKLLFILISLLPLASIYATPTNIISTNQTSDYYIITNENISASDLKTALENYDWQAYAPTVVGIKNNVIYFQSEKDLMRFLCPGGSETPFLSWDYTICPKIGHVYVYKSTITRHPSETVDFTTNINSTFQNAYVYSILSGTTGTSYAVGWYVYIKVGDMVISDNGDGYSGSTIPTKYEFSEIAIPSIYEVSISASRPMTLTATTYLVTTSPIESDAFSLVAEMHKVYSVDVYTEPDSSVYIDGNYKGNTGNGGYIKLLIPIGKHELKITKEGFWDYTTTIEIKNDTTLHIDLTPKNSIFRVSYNVTDAYPNSVAEVRLTLNPIRTAYGATMQISGVDVVKVYYKNALLAPSNGAYVLGTVDSPVDVEIQFKTPSSWGEHSFVVTITASDIEGNQYTTQEQITYDVKELPFLLQTPDTWKIGDNVVTITDQSGEDYSVLLSLKTVDGKEIWSQSQGFNAYDSHDFVVPINQSGDYVLEILAKGGEVKTYIPVHVIDPIKLLTKEVNATKGGVASVKLEIENPTSSVKYYDAQVIGEIFDVNNTPKQTFSIAPGENKVVELKFKVPENLTYDSYELQVEIFEKGEAKPIFSDKVVLKIVEGSFLPIFGDTGLLLWVIVVGVILLGGIGAYLLFRNRN